MSKFNKLLDRITRMGQEKEHDGLRVTLANGDYLVAGASPQKDGHFDVNGNPITTDDFGRSRKS